MHGPKFSITQFRRNSIWLVWVSVLTCFAHPVFATATQAKPAPREQVVGAARELLESANVSYVYGGNKLGDESDCLACNRCLDEKKPKPTSRLTTCPACNECSLDCSHFTQLVYESAGLEAPYLPTALMLSLSAKELLRRYHLVDLGRNLNLAAPGDLLVYDGHVIMLESTPRSGRADIIHATSGREVRGGGQGIQRVRGAPLTAFRGPLRRVLRHKVLQASAAERGSSRRVGRLRPIGPSK